IRSMAIETAIVAGTAPTRPTAAHGIVLRRRARACSFESDIPPLYRCRAPPRSVAQLRRGRSRRPGARRLQDRLVQQLHHMLRPTVREVLDLLRAAEPVRHDHRVLGCGTET